MPLSNHKPAGQEASPDGSRRSQCHDNFCSAQSGRARQSPPPRTWPDAAQEAIRRSTAATKAGQTICWSEIGHAASRNQENQRDDSEILGQSVREAVSPISSSASKAGLVGFSPFRRPWPDQARRLPWAPTSGASRRKVLPQRVYGVQMDRGVSAYPSLRDPGGVCVGLFYPDLPRRLQGRHLDYHWDGARADLVRDAGTGQVSCTRNPEGADQ